MKKFFTIIQLVIIAAIVVYGTVCLYRGDFEGTYATLPFLIFYYVWIVVKKRRRQREEAGEDDPTEV